MRHATLLGLSLLTACSGGELSVRQQFLAQSSVSVQFDTWVRSINNQNQDSLALVYHQVPELRALNTDGTVSRGWDETREYWNEFFDGVEIVNFVTDGHEIEVLSQHVVLMTFRHMLDTERTDGERGSDARGRGTIVWTRDVVDGLWKIHMLHLSERYRSGDAIR
jgi:ketosteroid isomerase-like protein